MNTRSQARAKRAFALRSVRPACLILALASVGVLSGCGNEKDTGTVVNLDPAQVRADAQKRIQEVENDPRIPAGQKAAILGRLRATAAGSGGEAEARNKLSKEAAPKK